MGNRIRFSERWDKLSCERFTTIRRWRADKENYYRGLVGQEFDVVLETGVDTPQFRQEIIGRAKLERLTATNFSDIPAELVRWDVRLNDKVQMDWFLKLEKMKKVLFLEFVKV